MQKACSADFRCFHFRGNEEICLLKKKTLVYSNKSRLKRMENIYG